MLQSHAFPLTTQHRCWAGGHKPFGIERRLALRVRQEVSSFNLANRFNSFNFGSGSAGLDTYIRKSVIFAKILEICVRMDLRHESGRGLRALQDASRRSGPREFPPDLGECAQSCRFVALANSDNSTLGFRAA